MKKLILLVVTCLFWFSLYLYIPFLTPFLISLGLSATLAGVIFGAHSFVQLVLRLPVGMKSEAIGKQKPFVMMGMLFTVVSSMVMWAFPSPAMLLAGNAISGFASTMYVSFTLLYAQYYKKEETGKAMGVLGGVVEVGILAAFVFGGVLYDRAGIRLLFFVSAAVAAVGLAISVFVKEKPAPRQTVSIQTLRSVIRDKRLIVSSVLGILIKALVFATAFAFTPKMAQDIGANGIEVGIVSAVFIAASVIGSFFVATKTGKRIGGRRTSVIGFACLLFNTVAIPFITSIPMLVAVQFVGGLGYASLTAIFMANAVKNFGSDKKAVAMGFYQAVYSAGSTLGPILMGIFADAFHYKTAYLLIALIAVAGIAVALLGYPKKEKTASEGHAL